MSVDAVREMFASMVITTNPEAIARYYHPRFRLFTNGQVQTFEEFERGHRTVYATDVKYRIEYDEDAWVEAGDRVAGRLWITITGPDAQATRIEVVFIAQFADGLILTLWELTWPDWSRLPAFDFY